MNEFFHAFVSCSIIVSVFFKGRGGFEHKTPPQGSVTDATTLNISFSIVPQLVTPILILRG
ncbi:hypothetical protein AMTR_s00004p00036930 [Amborella trichopoda]|uniref:Uncharacterized protein n=1 Tax=Amborella trichopoda TaxID=13333 RepID=W1NDT0_AMBTC|nr:hypothetical protein AMTR_s00004p00036930 [Amborella trichopoda]